MAKFELLEDGQYKVTGELTQEDIEKINNFKNTTCLILENTKGQTSEIINQINSDNVYFRVLGRIKSF